MVNKMPKNSNKFQENEKVLCFHGPLLYEAKIQKDPKIADKDKETKESKDKTTQYFVHYLGWSKNWDEWVPEDRVLKINESSRQKQKELNEAQSKSNKTNKSAKKKPMDPKDSKEMMSPMTPIVTERPKAKPSTPAVPVVVPPVITETKDNLIAVKEIDGQRKKRIKVESNPETEDTITVKGQEIQIKISDQLKQYLVEDWDLIGQKKLVRLPSKVTVSRIVGDYVKLKLNTKQSVCKDSAVIEAAEAIKEYFNASIGFQLLYNFERNQYKDLIKDPDDGPKPSAIYGGIHLLRLFVRLGSLLSYLELTERSVQLISTHIHDFLKYLERNPSLFSANEYEPASPDYLKKSS